MNATLSVYEGDTLLFSTSAQGMPPPHVGETLTLVDDATGAVQGRYAVCHVETTIPLRALEQGHVALILQRHVVVQVRKISSPA